MKFITIMSAGLLAAGTVAAMPVEAQRYGYGYGGGQGWHGQRYGSHRGGWRGDRWDRRGPRWQGGHRWDRGPRWNRGSRWGRSGYGRVTCRTGYYGRECFRTFAEP